MILRPATPADLPEVRRIVDAAYALYVPRIGRRPAPMDDDHAARIAAGTMTVAEDGGRVAGLAVLLDQPDHLLLDNIAVDPAAQGRGVGRALLIHAEAAARAQGHREVRLYTNAKMTENLGLYARIGYVETHREIQAGFSRVFFRKALP